jgi:hypothetical protein
MKGFLYVILPITLFSIVGMWSPYFYVLLPVHQSEICLCSFDTLRNASESEFRAFQVLNQTVFFTLNWMFLLALIWMNYKIRHIKSNLSILSEMTLVVFMWTICCMVQYVWFMYEDVYSCCSSGPD